MGSLVQQVVAEGGKVESFGGLSDPVVSEIFYEMHWVKKKEHRAIFTIADWIIHRV